MTYPSKLKKTTPKQNNKSCGIELGASSVCESALSHNTKWKLSNPVCCTRKHIEFSKWLQHPDARQRILHFPTEALVLAAMMQPRRGYGIGKNERDLPAC